MKRFCVLIVFTAGAVVISGCGAVSSVEDSVTVGTAFETVEAQQGNIYENTRFGYSFVVPENTAVYSLTAQQTAVTADSDSEVVFVVEGESNFFSVRGLENGPTPHQWLSENVEFFYPTGEAAQSVKEFAGRRAIVLTGSDGGGTPEKIIALSTGGNLIVISYEKETPTFARLLESFQLFDL